MSDININFDIPPPVPPKDDFRPLTPPKDFPRINFLGSASVGPSTSQAINFEDLTGEPSTITITTNIKNSNTFPVPKLKSKKSNFGSLIQRLNRNSKPPRIDRSLSKNSKKGLKKVDLKQKQKEVLLTEDDLMTSTSTLYQEGSSTAHSTFTKTSDCQVNVDTFRTDIDDIGPLRNSIAKSANSSERADDDTIKGINRHSHVFEVFSSKSSGSNSTRESDHNQKSISSNIPPPITTITTQNISNIQNTELIRNNYGPIQIKDSILNKKDIENQVEKKELDEDSGDVSTTQSQAPESSVYTTSDFDSNSKPPLSNNRLSSIPNHFFDGLHNIKTLYLDRNSLRDIPEELLKLTKLEILDLSNNCISEFNSRIKIRRMKNLRRINLDNNVISDISNISKLKTLRELRVNNNLLSTLTSDISKLIKLRLLYLDNNQLTNLPDTIGRLKSLCVLRLNNNNIEILPTSICSLHQLQVLELRSNLLTQLPENIKELENLAKLDVSNNKLLTLPNDIVKCTRLTNLNVSNNLLETIPTKFGQLSRLNTLNLRENKINNLPADLGKLTNLIELDLSFNELIVLPDELGKLIKLMEIKLNNNPSLLAIPSTFMKLTQIRKVHLQHCNLSQIPFEMGNAYSQLKYVNLSYNLFDTMPSLNGMDKVIIFDISNNRIDDLTIEIKQFEIIREFYVVNNKLQYIPKSIGKLKRLEILDLSENMIIELPLSIGDCQSLRELKLRGNSIETLPITLGKLKDLNVFYIGKWPMIDFNIIQDNRDNNRYDNLKINPYEHKIPAHVERTLLWRMHDSILKRLRDIDNIDNNFDFNSEKSRSPSNESNNSQQDINSININNCLPTETINLNSSTTTINNLNNLNNLNNGGGGGNNYNNVYSGNNNNGSSSNQQITPPIPRDDIILKMTVIKGVYDQIMKDMRNNDYDKESSGDDNMEFPDNGKKKKFAKLNKFLKIGDKQ
ncbi:7540_t:CDS:2 [Diversispora eburnea]|uniref:7540_t:CDS:1 n=1 Tax=Diversispora eburnea TaxID=1213867 RepID=A0A9N8VCE3_9GLOM|nr:7540_t:CDS:2 [Diversispora eburnea]